MASLADQISRLTNTAPKLIDPEDDIVDETSAVGGQAAVESDNDDDGTGQQSTKLTRRSALVLADTDVRYAGKKTSRNKLKHNFGDFSDSEGDDDDDVEESEGSDSEEDTTDNDQLKQFKAKMKQVKKDTSHSFDDDHFEEGDGFDDEEEEEASSDDFVDEEEEEEEEKKQPEEEEEEDDVVKKFSESSLNEEVARGEAAKHQLALWDAMLEQRIKLQRILSQVNQLPQTQLLDSFVAEGGQEMAKTRQQGEQSLQRLLDALVQLQTSLLSQNTDTRPIAKGQTPKNKVSSDPEDEEITSSESEPESEEESQDHHKSLKRKIKFDDYSEFLAKRHTDFKVYRDNTIQKWYDKTRLASGKLNSKSFTAFDQSAIKQIEQILTDKPRLLKRTQLKRTNYRILGQQEETHDHKQEEDGEDKSADQPKHYSTQIFDDDDFYHKLLRELIERKSTDLNDPIAISRQWLEIQKLRSKTKRKVDTRASKGRKIRYDVHPKLVNFMAPRQTGSWVDESKNDLYSSLFGQRHKTINTVGDT